MDADEQQKNAVIICCYPSIGDQSGGSRFSLQLPRRAVGIKSDFSVSNVTAPTAVTVAAFHLSPNLIVARSAENSYCPR